MLRDFSASENIFFPWSPIPSTLLSPLANTDNSHHTYTHTLLVCVDAYVQPTHKSKNGKDYFESLFHMQKNESNLYSILIRSRIHLKYCPRKKKDSYINRLCVHFSSIVGNEEILSWYMGYCKICQYSIWGANSWGKNIYISSPILFQSGTE